MNAPLGCPALLHKWLAALRKQGHVEEQAVHGVRRTNLLVPTPKTLAYLDKPGDAPALQQG